jgi:hypothetical protein
MALVERTLRMNPNAALSTATKPQIIGALKAANSTDTDVLLHVKEDLLDQYRPLKMMSMVPILCGGLISLTIIGAIIGIPLIFLGFFLRRKCKRNMDTVESAYEEYLASLGLKRLAPAPPATPASARAV